MKWYFITEGGKIPFFVQEDPENEASLFEYSGNPSGPYDTFGEAKKEAIRIHRSVLANLRAMQKPVTEKGDG